ncbi:MAG: methyltransferase domain-containing protein [Anaerolineaceae bacterium]|nr:methyltransferase domain-containing protein [Anaerolineaceae bacterium]
MTAPDPDYLKNEQYKDATRLQARARLHADYSRNPYGWFEWQFDLYKDLPANAQILELGAGAGWLWLKNRQHIPAGWDITLSDFSAGMVEEQHQNLAKLSRPFHFAQTDIQAIDFPDQIFDAVIANHMLYHVPDRAKAIREMRRVLKPGGTVFTATNGERHLQEIHNLLARFGFQPGEYLEGFVAAKGYTLENAADQLQNAFEHVELHRYDDAIVLTEAKPLIDYILSFPIQLSAERSRAFKTFVEVEFNRTGTMDITKDMGVLVAR